MRIPRFRGAAQVAVLLVVLLSLMPLPSPLSAQAARPTVVVGVVTDPGPLPVAMRERLLQEIRALTQREFDVRFPADYAIVSDGTAAGARRALQALYGSATVDLVIAGGAVTAHVAAVELPGEAGLPKPTLAAPLLHAKVQEAPLSGDASGVTNLCYITYPVDVDADLAAFAQVAPLSHVAILLPATVASALPGLSAHYRSLARERGLEATVVPVPPVAADILKALPPAADAVYVAQPLGLPAGDRPVLAEGLVARRLPAFVALGRELVDAGLLMGLHAEDEAGRQARRLALNLQRLLLGEPAAEVPVFLHRAERLILNARTAEDLGLSPSWSVMTEAELVGAADGPAPETLSLSQAMRHAQGRNLELQAMLAEVAAGRQRVREARARLLPQVELSATGVVIDEALASPLQAQRTVAAGVAVEQALYAEPAWAAWAAQVHQQRALEAELSALRLDVTQAAAKAYLNVLRAETSERVERQNLELARSNLALARIRQEVGASGASEVYRWESQIATARVRVIDASAVRNGAEIGLNRVLNRPLEASFTTEETGLFDPDLVTHDIRFIRFLDNKRDFRVFRDFMAAEALDAAPELVRMDAALAAAERSLVSARRARWLPTFGLRGELTRSLLREGAGSAAPAPGGDATWSVGASAVFPLSSGGAQFAAAARAAREVAGLHVRRAAVAEAVEARVRVALHRAGAGYAAIRLSEDAALAAARNLELVKDAYGRGVVSILGLLDAQNAAILAQENAANAVFDFLIDEMEVERAMGKLYLFADEAEREAWFQRALSYVEAHGGSR